MPDCFMPGQIDMKVPPEQACVLQAVLLQPTKGLPLEIPEEILQEVRPDNGWMGGQWGQRQRCLYMLKFILS